MERALRRISWGVSALPAMALLLTLAVGATGLARTGRLPTYGTYNPLPPDPVAYMDRLMGAFTGLTALSLFVWPFVEIAVVNRFGAPLARRQAALYLGSLAALVAIYVIDPGGFAGWLLD